MTTTYQFVGYQIVEQAQASTIAVNYGSLTGGTIQTGDVGHIFTLAGPSTSLGLVHHTASGHNREGGIQRNPLGGLGYVGIDLVKVLNGTEGSVTVTDTGSRGTTFLAIVLVYRNVTYPTATFYNGSISPNPATDGSSPYLEINPTHVSATAPSLAHSIGTDKQQLLYHYMDLRNTFDTDAAIQRDGTDSNLIERVAYTTDYNVSGLTIFVSLFDEEYASSSNYPTRMIETHWTNNTSSHYSNMLRMEPTQANVTEAAAAGDAWGWAG